MSQGEKALAKVLSGRSDRNISFAELRRALELKGWHLDRVQGSHHIFLSPKGLALSVPRHGDPIKAPYVRQARDHLQNET